MLPKTQRFASWLGVLGLDISRTWFAGKPLIALGGALLVACTSQKAGEGLPPEAGTSAARLEPTAPTSSATPAAQPVNEDFRLAMRVGDWADAARIIDALPEAERKAAEARFARAHAAFELGDFAVCVKHADGLEKELPILASEIAETRAHCQLEAGPFDAAAAFFAGRDTSRDRIRTALAFERAKQFAKAKAAIDQVVTRETARRKRTRGKRAEARLKSSFGREAEAREILARILDAEGKPKLAEQQRSWIATQAPGKHSAEASAAQKLSKQQRFDRAMAFARDGDIEQTDSELELLEGSAGPAIPLSEQTHAKGWARYMARHYKDAAPLLEQAAKLGSQHAVRDTYYAAKAWSRADEDQRAIEMYERLMVRFASSSYADHSRYMAARLRYIHGEWDGAQSAYKAYLAKYPKGGQHTAEARYELAVAWLAGGKFALAEKALSELRKATKDDRDEARLLQLEGVALAGQDKPLEAAKKFREVIETRPLSFAALSASARLKQMGHSPPPPIQPATAAAAKTALALQLPPKVQALHNVGLSLHAESELERSEVSFRKAYAERADEALCQAYAMLGSAARRYRVGQRAVSWSALNTAPNANTRWTWECIYPEPFLNAVERESVKNELPQGLVFALMRQESGFRPKVVSPAKAVGLMQLIPPTAKNVAQELSVEYKPELLRVPAYNIRFGSYYLKKVMNQFSGNVPLALAAYNAGPSAVGRWLKTGHQLPLDIFVARIPYGETRGYVARVIGNLARYAYLEGGEAAVPQLDLALPADVKVPDDAY